jgi:predicted RNase H-like HicB family nuclease
MLTKYICAAMPKATSEILSDGAFYREIPGFQGVDANTETLEACREVLQEVLEWWVILGLRLAHSLPVADNIDLTVHREAAYYRLLVPSEGRT